MANKSIESDLFRRVAPGPAEDRIARDLERTIQDEVHRIGLLGRVFSRTKSANSLEMKLATKRDAYIRAGRRLQDLFGVRVALYFADDSDVAQDIVKSRFAFDSASVTEPTGDVFGPSRCNLVFRLPESLAGQSPVLRSEPLIDATFEVQFRTVLSEGWHEVEHDLRYKRQAEWAPHADLGRALNGVMASLENSDWTMLKIFEELAWRHYKAGRFPAMIQAKFRLRMQHSTQISKELDGLLRSAPEFTKAIFRVDRADLLRRLLRLDGPVPISPQNIVFIANHFFIGDEKVSALAPAPVAQILERNRA